MIDSKAHTDKSKHKHSPKRLAVIFPGQGSQAVGMLAELSEHYPIVQQTFAEASDALNFDLWEICHDEQQLGQTQYTQPALLTASMAVWRILQEQVFTTLQPLYLAGHSLGEYSALCASDMLSLDKAVKLVYQRGQLMQETVIGQNVIMAAVLGLEDLQVTNLCEQTRELYDNAIVNTANFNSPGQVVIAGNQCGVEAVIDQVKNNMGKKALPLKVSVPSHCQLMDSATEVFAKVLAEVQLQAPKIPIIQNRHAQVETGMKDINNALIEQLNNPVLWSQTMNKLAEKKIDMVIECGNGNVLSNLAKRQTTPIVSYPTDKIARIEKIIEILS